MQPNELVRQAQRCLAEVLKEFALRCGGTVLDEHGLLLVAVDHPCPIFVNSALRTGPIGAEEALHRSQAFFAARKHPCETWVLLGADDDLEQAAVSAGMRVAIELVGMVLQQNPEMPDIPAGSELRRVQDVQGVRDFARVAKEAFAGEAPGFGDLIGKIFSDPRSLLAPDTAGFVVYHQGDPASVAMAMVQEGVAWIGWVATAGKFRGQGLGRLATAAATRAGFALGADFASLEATKMGVPVYTRLGYREVLRYRTYWPAEFVV